ncbi:RNA polymerase sigma-70 factor (ECF subfamily) [Pedobacter sp. AK017]|uniref:RNA polymerase sigma factor n=1 Tax=Pedobacter sp. AK017 TaxID=2723073 RepID=UPI00160D793C|nr:sigma-70 family RNA polymerase sigma factor [Pedobacter sp. AK017]MBB5439480.1 RNA polymerase sigma-70 factor (ECF subfamily) [Pedobacter sp. AK017]
MTSLDEKKILEELNAGNYQAFTVLYEKYWETLFLYVQRIIHNESEAKDIIQDTFLTIWNLKGKLGHVHSFKAYALTIAGRKALRHIRNHAHKTELIDGFITFLKDHEPNALDQLIKNELAVFVNQEIDKMPERMRETYKKSREEGLSNREIAALMEVSDQTVKKQINYSLRHLRLGLSKFHVLFIFCFLFQ